MSTKPVEITVFFVKSKRNGEHVDHLVLIGDSLERFSVAIAALTDPSAWSRAISAFKTLVEAKGGIYHGEHGRAFWEASSAILRPFCTDVHRQILALAALGPIFGSSGAYNTTQIPGIESANLNSELTYLVLVSLLNFDDATKTYTLKGAF